MDDATPLLNVEPGYRNVLRARLAINWAMLCVPAFILGRVFLSETPWAAAPPIAVAIVGGTVLIVAPSRIYRRLLYRLDYRLLQVMRGWLFHTDTIVPFVRVQHLDVTRGPLDKLFGTATLVVHTAGTRNSIVTVPGLAPGPAAEIRDIIREHVRTDFA
jgi:membrane protein YdbS with pleckstrin-like domain